MDPVRKAPDEPGRPRSAGVAMGDDLPDPADPADAGDLVWQEYRAQFHDYSRAARRSRLAYQLSQGAVVVSAALVTLTAALSAPAWVPALLGALITTLAGLQQLSRWQDNWVDYRRSAEEMRQHGFAYAAGTEPYTGPDRRQLLATHRREVALGENARWSSRMQRRDPAG